MWGQKHAVEDDEKGSEAYCGLEKKSSGLSPLRVVSGRDKYGFLVLGSVIESDVLRTEDFAAVWFTWHD